KAKRIVEPPAPEKLKIIKEMIAGVIGFQADRGDQLIVESLPFESTLNQEPPVTGIPVSAAPVPQYPVWMPSLLRQPNGIPYIGIAGSALVLLIFGGLMAALRRRKPSSVRVEDGAKAIN